MAEVGIRALKQNASAVAAEAVAGETVTITDRGRPVAQLTAIPASNQTRWLMPVALGRGVGRWLICLRPIRAPNVWGELAAMRERDQY